MSEQSLKDQPRSLTKRGSKSVLTLTRNFPEVVPYDDNAAIHTGQIRAELAKRGKPIGPYDQMIAGHARAQSLVLVTNNTKEFKQVPGLRLENWVGKK